MSYSNLACVKIEASQRQLSQDMEDFLRKAGWEHTSATVDCRWRWFKVIGGRGYGCGTDEAFEIQSTVDCAEYASDHPEEFDD